MALKLSISRSENRLCALFPNGYFRVLEATPNKDSGNVRIRVASYADEEARRFSPLNQQSVPGPGLGMHNDVKIKEEDFTVSISNFNAVIVPDGLSGVDELFSRAYLSLKAHVVKFKDALDV